MEKGEQNSAGPAVGAASAAHDTMMGVAKTIAGPAGSEAIEAGAGLVGKALIGAGIVIGAAQEGTYGAVKNGIAGVVGYGVTALVEGTLGFTGVGAFAAPAIGYAADLATENAINSIPQPQDYQTGLDAYATGNYPGANSYSPFNTYRDVNMGPVQCFPRGTPILVDNNQYVEIQFIIINDYVMNYDSIDSIFHQGLKSSKVIRIFRGVTDSWLKLSCGLTVTPGHLFLTETGRFERIDSIVARGGMIVAADGDVERVTAERVVYSDATRHLYEEAEDVGYGSLGSSALAPQIRRGWRTYNFEVEQLHTYIAAGHRVHNDSIGDYNSLAGDLAADVHNWSRMLVQMEIISSSVLDAPYEIGSLS